MAEETMGGEQQSKAAASTSSQQDASAGKTGGQNEAGKPAEARGQPNPSDPGNTGTTPGSVAEVG